MRTNINLIPVFCILLLCACKSGNASSQNSKEAPKDTITSFTLPAIPPMLTAPELRADFLVKHYWDNVNFADTNYIHHPENPVHLPGVDFIRVYTGVNQQCGWLGETSTELSRAEDLHVEDQTHYLPNP